MPMSVLQTLVYCTPTFSKEPSSCRQGSAHQCPSVPLRPVSPMKIQGLLPCHPTDSFLEEEGKEPQSSVSRVSLVLSSDFLQSS